jgi:hypothetical protein
MVDATEEILVDRLRAKVESRLAAAKAVAMMD